MNDEWDWYHSEKWVVVGVRCRLSAPVAAATSDRRRRQPITMPGKWREQFDTPVHPVRGARVRGEKFLAGTPQSPISFNDVARNTFWREEVLDGGEKLAGTNQSPTISYRTHQHLSTAMAVIKVTHGTLHLHTSTHQPLTSITPLHNSNPENDCCQGGCHHCNLQCRDYH